MSEEMPSWRSLASAASRSIKGYVAQQRDPRKVGYTDRNLNAPPLDSNSSQPPGPSFRQAWSQWAGQKLRSLGQNDEGSPNGIEKLALFPGWAARKYRTVDVTSEGKFSKLTFPPLNCKVGSRKKLPYLEAIKNPQ